jgi:UMF1 family MFS transporter
MLGMTLFVVANIGASGSFVFYDALLPHVARTDEVDRVSTMGYAAGYLGGGLMLLFNLALIRDPERFGLPEGTLPTRLAFVSVAVWWAVFSIPLLLRVHEPPRVLEEDERPGENALRVAFTRLKETFHELRHYRNAFLLLLAFLIYNDGIQTIYRMATIIGADKGFDTTVMIGAIAAVQFVGIPFAVLFGQLASRFGAKRMVLAGIAVYAGITVFGYWMETEGQFIALAVMVGMVQGGCQALSRSLFASMIPTHKSGEFFALFAVGEKFAGIFGPGLFALSISLTGSSQSAILSILVFFALGALLLTRVDVDEGRRAATVP